MLNPGLRTVVARREAILLVLWHGQRIRRCDVEDLAAEVQKRCARLKVPHALFVYADGHCGIYSVDDRQYPRSLARDSAACCGVYTAAADTGDLVADIRDRCKRLGWALFDE